MDDRAVPRRRELVRFAATAVPLALLMLAVRALELERSFGLPALAPVVFVGFCVHAWLPARLKLPFFLALSLAAFFVVLGPRHAGLVVAISLGLFGLCHLPARIAWRAALLVLAAVGLAAARFGLIETSWASAVVPVVAAMFMFRAIVYLYDLATEDRPAPLSMRLSYFFLLPNVCFLLFPVVDFRTFQRTYRERDAHDVHQRGLRWILRGIVHLLLYRVVYVHLTPAVAEIESVTGVVRFVLSSYLLFLRVSGHFHLAVGLLHLFGFHLPETNRNWLLADGFTDTWRRINIYWTEFMKKVIYYPAYARLRRRGMLFGMLGATALTFVATWLLHVYQWFWLTGALPLATDGLFWGLAGALALATVLHEARSGAPLRGLVPRAPTWSAALARSLRVAGTFCAIALTWSVWCSPSLAQWTSILAQARHSTAGEVLAVTSAAVALVLLGTVAQRVAPRVRDALERPPVPRAAFTAAGALLVALLGFVPLRASLGEPFARATAPLVADTLNARDRERVLTGYYDRLVQREGFGGRAWEEDWAADDVPPDFWTSLAQLTNDAASYRLVPSHSIDYIGAPLSTNRWGMRDRDYELAKPPGTFRIALFGTCDEMGSGVADGDVWEAVAEERLNVEVSPRTGLRYEILNFSVLGYAPYQHWLRIRDELPAFEPDVVVLTNHLGSSVKHLIQVATAPEPWPGELAPLLERLGVEPGMDEIEIRRLVGPLGRTHRKSGEVSLETRALRRVHHTCEKLGAIPVLARLPFVSPSGDAALRVEHAAALDALAARLGFELLDASSAFDGHDLDSLRLSISRRYPNVSGHRLIADAFVEALLERPRFLGAP